MRYMDDMLPGIGDYTEDYEDEYEEEYEDTVAWHELIRGDDEW